MLGYMYMCRLGCSQCHSTTLHYREVYRILSHGFFSYGIMWLQKTILICDPIIWEKSFGTENVVFSNATEFAVPPKCCHMHWLSQDEELGWRWSVKMLYHLNLWIQLTGLPTLERYKWNSKLKTNTQSLMPSFRAQYLSVESRVQTNSVVAAIIIRTIILWIWPTP